MSQYRTRQLLVLLLLSAAGACSSSRGTAAASPMAPAPSATPALPDGVTPQMVTDGGALFNQGACQRCHGLNGVGGANGPNLTTGPWLHADGSYAAIVRVVTAGVPATALKDPSRRFAMNPRGGPMNLTDQQARTVAAYVWSISRQKR